MRRLDLSRRLRAAPQIILNLQRKPQADLSFVMKTFDKWINFVNCLLLIFPDKPTATNIPQKSEAPIVLPNTLKNPLLEYVIPAAAAAV